MTGLPGQMAPAIGKPERQCRHDSEHRQNTVMKLHGGDVLKRVLPPGKARLIVTGNQAAIHQGEGVVVMAGISPATKAPDTTVTETSASSQPAIRRWRLNPVSAGPLSGALRKP